jgi:putative ABC transport system permease protein
MLKYYWKIALRNLWRRKGFSFINITGLTIGMASATLILLWINHEISYDDFHPNKDHIYQVWNRAKINGRTDCWLTTPKVLAPALLKEYPGIANTARMDNRWFVTAVGEKKMSSHSLIIDPSFLAIFHFPLVRGNAATALNNSSAILITESFAKKLFGKDDPMARTIKVNQQNFSVTGILKDLPANTDFDFEYLLPWSYERTIGNDDPNWGNNSIGTFLQLQPSATEAGIDQQIKDLVIRNTKGVETNELFLHPMAKWHLYTEFENGKATGGLITTVRMFSLIAVFILLVACINFMNLSTARSEHRAREVGIRKVAGAYRSLLIAQFLGESVLMATLSGILAFLLVRLSLPAFDTLVGQHLTLPYDNPLFWGGALLFILVTGILAGSYPAFYLASFRPVAVLKGAFQRAHSQNFVGAARPSSKHRSSLLLGRNLRFTRLASFLVRHLRALGDPRKILVVLQFSFAILLIICTLIVMQQIRYARERTAGYDRARIVYHWTTGDLDKNYPMLRRALLASGVASAVSRNASPLTQIMSNSWSMQWAGKDPNDRTIIDRYSEDEGLIATAGLQLSRGRDLDLSHYPTDSTAALLNESAVRAMGFKHPLGQTVRDDDSVQYHVVGVVKDFVIRSPYEAIRPTIILGSKSNFFNVINIRLANGQGTTRADAGNTAAVTQQLATIQQIFRQYNPDYPFEYHFPNDDYDRNFQDTQRIATLTGLFAGLTIFISCLGLFGLAAYMAENRIKEIGVRKVLGASVLNITTLLTKDFLTLVLLSLLIASPIAWYTMNHWLQGYAYRIRIGGWVFLLAGSLSILISLLTVSYQAIAAARANPARSLRPE